LDASQMIFYKWYCSFFYTNHYTALSLNQKLFFWIMHVALFHLR